MDELRITTVQAHLFWEDIDKNIEQLDVKLNALTEHTDIIILPEMFTTGFTMKPQTFAESHPGKGLQWMQKKSKEKNCALVGSISIKDGEKFYNRLYWVIPDGTYKFYDKRHLFQMGKEDLYYTAGSKKLIVDYKGWKICPLICYDLRFPVWSRNTKESTYDILIYVANWPEVRSYPWKQLLVARAIENQAYVVGVNRIGEDGNSITHSGDSCVINPRGEIMSKTRANEDVSETVVLTNKYLSEFRKLFPVMLDGDEFDLK